MPPAWRWGVDEAAPEKTAYCLSVSTSVTAVASVGVSASVSLDSLRFSVSAGSAGVSGALGVAVSRGLNQRKISRSPHAHKAAMKW